MKQTENEYISFEMVDQHVNRNVQKVQKALLPAKQSPRGISSAIGTEQAAKLSADKLKTIYAAAKPILSFAMMFLPAKWKTILQGLIAALDGMTTA